ncbi:MAG: FkbM family methyltransferase [Candidatus Pacearchaeota archaeon]
MDNEEKLIKDIYRMKNWKGWGKTLYWLFRDFSLISKIKILKYYIKKKTGKISPDKVIEIKFKFYGTRLKVKIRENNDDFAILREIFLFWGYAIPKHKQYKVIIDGGAHLGFATIFYAITNKESKIFSFEPSKETLELLRYNINENKINANICPEAILDKKEVINFNYDKNNPSFSRIEEKGNRKIETTSLDLIIDKFKLPSVDLIKLDLEGYEIEALNGLIKNNPKVEELIIENHSQIYSTGKIFKIIKEKGFKIIPISHSKIIYGEIEYPIIYSKK